MNFKRNVRQHRVRPFADNAIVDVFGTAIVRHDYKVQFAACEDCTRLERCDSLFGAILTARHDSDDQIGLAIIAKSVCVCFRNAVTKYLSLLLISESDSTNHT